MSYSSESILDIKANIKDVKEFVELLGYKSLGYVKYDNLGTSSQYHWFNYEDYKSIYGVELSIYIIDSTIHVETRTNISRSYYDLVHQNKTIKLLRKYFGGIFITDAGKGRYLHPNSNPPSPSASGCHLAFTSFGSNLIRVHQYIDNRDFGIAKKEKTGIYWLDQYNPGLFSNNLILPFLVSIFEDYWKTTYIALLRYSENKESVLKSNKISAERLVEISQGILSVEEGFANSISFARVSMVCKHFSTLDRKLNFASVLMKPYRRRKKNLFESLEEMTEIRNQIIHEASYPTILEDRYIEDLLFILHDAIERCYKELTTIKNWKYKKTWSAGSRKRYDRQTA